MELEGSLLCSQNRTIGPSSESDKPKASPPIVTSNVQNTYIVTLCQRKYGDNCAIVGYYAACSGNSIPMFQDNLSFSSWLLSRNVGKGLPLNSRRKRAFSKAECLC